ncbi:Glutamine--fructose-6-phosphate aminotransferase [isomerizing] [hydrothermal vent metagenome]|uniref:Glutamine--fructose-6-phosphate aminotransferase [isomerizing] n=1 Tax=hydrothermal vent metagenome TaxID=652676 RepID=A0A3B1C5K7_9ZZZZ
MCGIAGIVALENISDKLVKSIQNLEYRGYDSCGIAILNGNSKIQVRKNTGFVAAVAEREGFGEVTGNIGIAHTRWATHGKVTKENAHPHPSCDGAFCVVHNGIISNYTKLRLKLKKLGHVFKSETDTEVITHLVEHHYKKSVEKAFVSALKEIEGTYAITLISPYEPDKIFCARKESPLIIGLGSGANYIGSDFNAFIEYTKSAVIMEDHEYAIVTHDSFSLKLLSNGESVSRPVQEIMWDSEMAQKGGFPHYMLKEIYEQPQVVLNAMDIDRAAIHKLAEVIATKERVYLTGVGTTFYVVQFGQYLFSKYSGITPNIASSDEFRFIAHVNDKSFVLAASQSGETYDTLTALRHAKEKGAVTGAIVNVMGSSMARMVDHLVLQGSGPEICVISTKAALAQMIIFARLAIEVGLIRKHLKPAGAKKLEKELRLLPAIIEKVINERSGFIHSVAKEHCNIRHWLFLGRGKYYPVARESALKMKEVSYVHAEGMPSGFLKHGTIALIDDNLNSVVFMPPESEKELYKLTLSSAEEIRARDGYVLGISFESNRSQKDLPFSDIIPLPKTGEFTAPFVEMVVAQLLSYYTATSLKRNVDKPRALAKSVTVE